MKITFELKAFGVNSVNILRHFQHMFQLLITIEIDTLKFYIKTKNSVQSELLRNEPHFMKNNL